MSVQRVYKLKKDVITDDHPAVVFKMKLHQVQGVKIVDLRPLLPPVYDQGQLGSCTANAIGAAYQYSQIKQKQVTPFVPSRLFIYYNERKDEGTINEDSGAQLATGVKSVSTIGVVPESDWPYNISKFTVVPPNSCYVTSKSHKCTNYYRVAPNSLAQIKQALINGFPVIFGMAVYASMESVTVAHTGVVPMPQPNEECLGGHAVLIVGFNDNTKTVIVRNSWGSSWGQKGYFTLPYAYITNPQLTCDFWVLMQVNDTANPVVHKTTVGGLKKILADSVSKMPAQLIDDSKEIISEVSSVPGSLIDHSKHIISDILAIF